jgi:hypothetical protein
MASELSLVATQLKQETPHLVLFMTESGQSKSLCHQSRGYHAVRQFKYSPLTYFPVEATIRSVFISMSPVKAAKFTEEPPAVYSKSNIKLNTNIYLSLMHITRKNSRANLKLIDR